MSDFDKWYVWYSRNWGNNTKVECNAFIDVLKAAFDAGRELERKKDK